MNERIVPMTSPIPEGCNCSWGIDLKKDVKYIKRFYAMCAIADHRAASRMESWAEAKTSQKEQPKKARGERGKDKGVRARKQSA